MFYNSSILPFTNPYLNPYQNPFNISETNSTLNKRIVQAVFDMVGIFICFLVFGIVYLAMVCALTDCLIFYSF